MTRGRQAVSLKDGLPIGAISGDGRLVFPTAADLDFALDLGIFYLKIPKNLDLEGARRFGSELLAPKRATCAK